MKKRTYRASNTGLSFFDVLALIFIVLKLVGVIDWPWIWVLSPLWIGLILILVVYAVLYILMEWL